jgi:hypothetical protein
MLNERRPVVTRIAETIESASSGPLASAGLLISDPETAKNVGRELEAFRGKLPYY